MTTGSLSEAEVSLKGSAVHKAVAAAILDNPLNTCVEHDVQWQAILINSRSLAKATDLKLFRCSAFFDFAPASWKTS